MFNRNITALEKINKSLAGKIKQIPLSETEGIIGAVKNQNGEYILTRNGKYIDDIPGPLNAAKEVYAKNIKSAVSRHDFIVIFGLGLGNLLDYVHTKSMCSILLYEPDINILRFTFEYVDLTRYFNDGRLFIASNIAECAKYIQEKYLLDDKIEFVYLKNYLAQNASQFNVLTEKIYDVCKAKIIDMNTIKKLSKSQTKNIMLNSLDSGKCYPVNILKNKFKGKTALILGAGPSLKDNLEKIKQFRDRYVIFAVHRTLKTLELNGITPDFCVITDANYVQKLIPQNTEYTKNINFIADIKADNCIKKIPVKNCFTFYSANNIFSEKLAAKLPETVQTIETGGTATVCAYKCAKLSGFKNIIFAGVDLAFKDDTVYCDGKIAAANDANTVKIQNIVMQTAEIKSVTGEYVKTRADYASFVKQFETLFARDKTSNIYNITTFGAFIAGMKYDSLENITPEETVSSEKTVSQAITDNADIPEKIHANVISIWREELSKITPIVDLINEWFEMYSQHPNFFEYAEKIVTKITSSMILQDCIQIELIKFSKMVLSKNDDEKKNFLTDLFKVILSYSKDLNNLIIS